MSLDSIVISWKRIGSTLVSSGRAQDLNPGASLEALDAIERAIGRQLPYDLHSSFSQHDGQASHADDLVDDWQLLPCSDVLKTWHKLKQIKLSDMSSVHECVPSRQDQWNEVWLPFAANGLGDHLIVDTSGGRSSAGRVCSYRHERQGCIVLADSFAEWLDAVASQLEREELELPQLPFEAGVPTMESLMRLLGSPLSSPQVGETLLGVQIDQEKDGSDTIIHAPKSGVDITSRRGTVSQVDLYLSPFFGETIYPGILIGGIKKAHQRSDVRRILGFPIDQDVGSRTNYSERAGWDAFHVNRFRIQFTYKQDWDGIAWISVTEALNLVP